MIIGRGRDTMKSPDYVAIGVLVVLLVWAVADRFRAASCSLASLLCVNAAKRQIAHDIANVHADFITEAQQNRVARKRPPSTSGLK